MKRGWAFLTLLVGCAWAAAPADGAFWKKKAESEPATSTATAERPAVGKPIRTPAPAPAPAPAVKAIAQPGQQPTVRRPHYRVDGPEMETTLLQLAESRELRRGEIVVLSRLLVEKQNELRRMDRRLQEVFGVDPSVTYQYDADSRCIYRLDTKEGAEELARAGGVDPEDLITRTIHRELATPDAANAFTRLVSAKKITNNEIRVLQLLLREKNMELKKVETTLAARFSIAPDKHYEYDASAQTLFEIVGVGEPVVGVAQ